MAELHDACPNCGLIVLTGHIFDAARMIDEYGPVLGLHKQARPETAKAGYVGPGGIDLTETQPEWYRCPRCQRSVIRE